MANKTISRLVVNGTTYDIADTTARAYSHLKSYWTSSSTYSNSDTTNFNLSTRAWLRGASFCGWHFNPTTGHYRYYDEGTYSGTTDMGGWDKLTNGAVLIQTYKVNFAIKTAQDNIHILLGLGEDLTNNTWPAAGKPVAPSMNSVHQKGIANTTFYASTRYISSFGSSAWETNTSYWYNGQAYLGNYTSTTLSSFWQVRYVAITWAMLYRGTRTGT